MEPPIDFARVMEHVWGAIRAIEPQDSPGRLRGAGVDVIETQGRLAAPGVIETGERQLYYRAAIIATGSRPAVPPIPGVKESEPLNTDTVWDLRELPARLVVLGGGPIGCELAQAFCRLGASVTMVEMADRLLLKEEPRASELILSRLEADGVDVRLGARATGVRDRDGGGKELTLAGLEQAPIRFDRVLVATGRVPRSEGLGLEQVGVQTDARGAVVVDSRLRTTAPGIFAVGDATGLLPFTHVAAHHARVATPNALFHSRTQVDSVIPWVTFTDPEVARVGLTEQDARDRWGDRVTVAEHDYAHLDRAVTDGEAYGFAKLIAGPRRRLVGATIAAPAGGETIAELTAWIARGQKLDAVSRTVHAYPTLAEAPARAADTQLATRYSSPHVRAIARPVLAALRALERPR